MVAEKPSIAIAIAKVLAKGQVRPEELIVSSDCS